MVTQVAKFKSENKLLEAQRIEQRTKYDLEMLTELEYVLELKIIQDISMEEIQVNHLLLYLIFSLMIF